MYKNNIFLTILITVIFYGCSSSDPRYREGEPVTNFQYPENKEIERRFYLIGDGGYSPPGGLADGLTAFKNYLDSVPQMEKNYTLFLGDNIYPIGMVPEDHPLRESAEYRLGVQTEIMEGYKGNAIFMPGNHEWYGGGIDALEREQEFLQEHMKEEGIYYPEPGCALRSLEISEDVQLIIVDSYWYLANWDKHPTVNVNCSGIKSRESFFLEIESELKENQNKTVVFAIHHPLYTNGIHGGQYDFLSHIFPAQDDLPLPLLGSLAMLIRTSGGVSVEDAQNLRYKTLVNRLETIAQKWGNVVFVSGHDHSLQYIEHEQVKQIVSGSASKHAYVNLSDDGLFAYPGEGFAVLDIFKDGSSWVSYFGSYLEQPKLLYQKEIFSNLEPFETDTLPDNFPQTVMASVYTHEEAEKGAVYEALLGDRYSDIYEKEIKAEVVDLDTLFGGVEILRRGGGHQTRSLRLKDKDGREYNMRALKKSAVQLLQSVPYKNTPIKLDGTIAEKVIQDLYTSAHPYAFLAIPKLSEAAGIYHTNPKIYYIPKQEALGTYNREFGDELYMIVERPEENWLGYESFGKPNHDIESTSGVYERLRRDEEYEIDEEAYIRARIFDMLIGDWDRHQDQWRWSEFEDEEGVHTFRPIPRDRDQVFSNFDGAVFSTLRGIASGGQFVNYDEDLDNLSWFNSAAIGLDRTLIQNAGREEWIKQAQILQEKITDEVIEEAFAELPGEVQDESLQKIKEKLRARRENIIDITQRYYRMIAETAIVTGTDKDDYVEVERLPAGKTRISIYRKKDEEKANLISDKTYSSEYTEEIWLYGLYDDDIFEVTGDGENNIKLRIIGGQNNDIYRIKNGENVQVYDYESQPNTIEENDGAEITFTDDYDVNVFNKDLDITSENSIVPVVGYSQGDGFKIGFRDTYTIYGFRRNPFTARHQLSAGYYFQTNSFDVAYEGEFAHAWGDYNLLIGAHLSAPDNMENFFGYGNETINNEALLQEDYYRARISRYGGKAGLVRKNPYGSYLEYIINFESVKIRPTEGDFLDEEFDAGEGFYNRKFFIGIEGTYRYESYDFVLNPTNGMKFELVGGTKTNIKTPSRTFAYINPYLGFYRALSQNRKWVLHSRVQAEVNLGDDFEIYQSASLGGDNGLRGYWDERFSGEAAFATSNDLRYSFNQFQTGFLPMQIGVFSGYDIGRVWLDGEESGSWHNSYGGGFWINSSRALSGTVSFFGGNEGWRVSFGFGFSL